MPSRQKARIFFKFWEHGFLNYIDYVAETYDVKVKHILTTLVGT